MKYLFLILALFGVRNLTFGQIAIGATTSDPSAILDLNVSSLTPKKGLLLPRLELNGNDDIATIPNPAEGLWIYNLTDANSGSNFIAGKATHYFDGAKWQHFTHLEEVKSYKFPLEFATTSKFEQIFTTSELNDLNVNNEVVPIHWAAADLYISNPTDIEFIPGSSSIRILTSSYYDFSGMVSFKLVVSPANQSSHVVLILQKSVDGGTSWTNILASSTAMEQGATGQFYTITLPNFIHYFNSNDLLRIAIKKPNYTNANNFVSSSGLAVSNVGVDVTKSVRVVRLPD